MRILGLDLGDKTVGVAISDPFGLTAQPLKTLFYQSQKEVLAKLKNLVCEQEVTEIIVGLPLNMNGSFGPRAEKTKAFAQKILDYLTDQGHSLKLEFWDERLSTKASERNLIFADVSRKKRKKVIDKMAAQFILQGYLDSKIH